MQDGNNIPNNIVPEKDEGSEIKDKVGEVTQEFQDGIAKSLTSGEQSEILGNDGKYLELYEKQNKVAKELEQRAEENNIRGIDGNKLYFDIDKIELDGDVIIYKPKKLRDFPHLFISENGTFREIPLLKDKIKYSPDRKGDSVIPTEIRKIRYGLYYVTLANCKDGRKIDRGRVGDVELGYQEESYIIDKEGNIIEQFGKLGDIKDEDGIHRRHTRRNSRGFHELEIEEYTIKGQKKSESTIIFDDKMNKLFTVDTQNYSIQYYDEKVCVYQEKKHPGKYYLVTNGTKQEIISKENLQGFMDFSEESESKMRAEKEKNKKLQKLPFEERYADINHYRIKYKGDDKKHGYIENDDGVVLYDIPNIVNFIEDNNKPIFETKDCNIEIRNWNKEGDILYIQKVKRGEIIGCVFINKNTGKNLELKGKQGEYSSLEGKLINVCGERVSEIYDENCGKLGINLRTWYGVIAVDKQENGVSKLDLYSTYTGTKICEVKKDVSTKIIKKVYTDDNGKNHLIVETVDGTLIEVDPEKIVN